MVRVMGNTRPLAENSCIGSSSTKITSSWSASTHHGVQQGRQCSIHLNLGGRTGKILRPSSVALKSKNQEINRLQLAVKLPWAIFFESVDILS
ncbi:hypothetical protein TNCV_3047131 [Trichonephila clavipes]|nr:hypothetical protein TNCV_3047131 [Trichonephila clavipes]